MIQKRYQHYTGSGIAWTKWFDYAEGDAAELARLQKQESNQFKGLMNEFRLVPNG